MNLSAEAVERGLRADVAALARPEGRLVGSAGHDRAREFLRARLGELELLPYSAGNFELPYRQGGERFCNLAALLPGVDRAAPPVLIGAHYDSVIAAPCTNDNAAAVAICLAVADSLRRGSPPARDIIFAFFDAEEPPYFLSEAMGSVRFVLYQMDGRGVQIALIQDLTGHEVPLPLPVLGSVALPRLKDLLFLTGAESHPRLAALVTNCPRTGQLPLLATVNENVGDLSDHHVFRRLGLPFLFFTCGRWPHYHQPSDTPERLAYGKMTRITEFLTHVALACAAECELPGPAGRPGADTVAFERALLRETFGPVFLPLIMRALGLPPDPLTREDLDAFAQRLMRTGL